MLHCQSTSPSKGPAQQGIAVRPRHVISEDPYPFFPSTTSSSNHPVLTFTQSSFSASNILGNMGRDGDEEAYRARQSRYPKVRQKSKSSGASPQKYPSPVEFNEEFINIITSSDSIDYGDSCDLFCPVMCSSSRSSNASGRSYLSQQYMHRYGSNNKLLQVPSASSLLVGGRGGRYIDDDDEDDRPRQQRSRSITVPIQHSQRSPERSAQVSIRRCSSASPQGRYLRLAQEQQQKHPDKEAAAKSSKQGRVRQRGFSLTAATAYIGSEWVQQQQQQQLQQQQQQQQQKVRRRRSSGYRRVSNHSIVTPYSTSTSSLSSSSCGSPKKEQKVSPYKRNRTLSMPSCGVTAQLTRQLKKSKEITTPESPDSTTASDKSQPTKPKQKKPCYDVVIVGSSNVGKATLAEYFSKGGSSGSDPGIGSDFEEDDDQDLCNGGSSILYKPNSDLKQQTQYDFSLRIFHQQNTAAVSHLYKYDAVLILYSVTDRESFQFAKEVLSEINLKNNNVPAKRPSVRRRLSRTNATETAVPAACAGTRPRIVILVGNKMDLERSRCVTTKEGKYLATLHGCKFIEVSASLDLGVDNLIQGLTAQVHLRHQKYFETHQSSAGESSSSSTSVAISKSSSSSSSSATTNNTKGNLLTSLSAHQHQYQQQRQRKKRSNSRGLALGAATSSFKLAQRLIDRLMSIRGSSGKSKSCLDLHSL